MTGTSRQEEPGTTVNAKLQLTPTHWYGWQMLPGYFGEPRVPYFSPICVKEVKPRRTGKGILALGFINTLYAEGVQDFTLDLRILKHEASYLVSEILYGKDGPSDRTAIISDIGSVIQNPGSQGSPTHNRIFEKILRHAAVGN
jgi:hypothetical protein